MPIARHIAYTPRTGYELLRWTGNPRQPVCVRTITVTSLTLLHGPTLPPDLERMLKGSTVNLLLHHLTIN